MIPENHIPADPARLAVRIASYGALAAAAMFGLKWMEFRLLVVHHSFEIYAGIIAVAFTLLGIWLAGTWRKPRTEIEVQIKEVQVEAISHGTIDHEAVAQSGLTKREIEVLQHMAEGLSNDEIANRLFVSLSTIKTHAARIFEKLEVSRRTQAIETARKRKMIA